MFEWINNKTELFKLDRSERQLEKEHKIKQAESIKKKDPSLLEEWECNYGDRLYADIRWSRRKLASDALLREADRLHLPRPNYNDKAQWDDEADEYGMPRGFILNAEAMTALRASIRKEKREKREAVEGWVKLLSGLLPIVTGLVGALIGLAAIWKHKQ
jgi:hypothetical protein